MTLLILELLIAGTCLVALGILLGWVLWGRTAMLDRSARRDAEQIAKAAERRAADIEAGAGDAAYLAEEVARLRHKLAAGAGTDPATGAHPSDAGP